MKKTEILLDTFSPLKKINHKFTVVLQLKGKITTNIIKKSL